MSPSRNLALVGKLRSWVAHSLLVLLSLRAARAEEGATNSLTPHLDTLWLGLYVLLGALVALIAWEVIDRMPRRVKIDAAAAIPEPSNDYIDPTKMKFAEPAARPAAPAPASFSPPPPPEPMGRPPAAPPPSSDDDNPFRKLSKLGGEDDSPLAPARPPVPRSEPASIPVPAAPTPSPASSSSPDSGASSGGWADLLQRVRAGEPGSGSASEDSGSMQSRGAMPPMTEEEAPSSSTTAWESLLKKSANDLGPAPDQSTVGGGDFQPRSIKLGGGGGGDEAPVVDPLRMALDNPSTDPDENLPDFVKKATRTIALDLKKGGEQTPPPPMPKTEG